jgi:hypothetical protein
MSADDAYIYGVDAPHPFNPHSTSGEVEVLLKIDESGVLATVEQEEEHRSFTTRGTLSKQEGNHILKLHRNPKMSKVERPTVQVPDRVVEEIEKRTDSGEGGRVFEILSLGDYSKPKPAGLHKEVVTEVCLGWSDVYKDIVDVYVRDGQIHIQSKKTGVRSVGKLTERVHRTDTVPAIEGEYELRDGIKREFSFHICQEEQKEISEALETQLRWKKEAESWLRSQELLFEVRYDISPIKEREELFDDCWVLLPNKTVEVLEEREKNLLRNLEELFVAEQEEENKRWLMNWVDYPLMPESLDLCLGGVYKFEEVRKNVNKELNSLSKEGGSV